MDAKIGLESHKANHYMARYFKLLRLEQVVTQPNIANTKAPKT